jgi:TolA-binding protein
MRALLATVFFSATALSCLATQRDHEALVARTAELETSQRALRADLDATRERLDNALRANADNGSDLVSEKARLNQLAGRLDEVAHAADEVKTTLASTRTELDARIDELKRAQAVQPTPAPPPVAIPADKAQHFIAIEAAYKVKDFGLVRTLGHEFMNRYATDEKADDVLYLMGDADLQDGHPSSALGEYNRLLKLFPKSNVLDKTLFGMGEAYFAMHDCANAKLAFQTCEAHFPRQKIASEAHSRIGAIDKAPPGTCAPP